MARISRITGDNGDNVLRGSNLVDRIKGLAGDDTLFGLQGDDIIVGGQGSDLVRGNDGDDMLLGKDARDKLFGQDGDDSIEGGDGQDKVIGAAGNDTLVGGRDNDLLAGGEGADTFTATVGAGRDKIRDFDPSDTLDFSRTGNTALSDLNILETSKGDAVINYGDSGFRLNGVSVSELDLSQFVFNFADDVSNSPPVSTPLAVGETRRGSIDEAGDIDVFAFKVVAGNTYTFSADSAGTFPVANPLVRLVDGSGTPIPLDGVIPGTSPNLILGFTAPRSEEVFLEVKAPGSNIGTYDVFSILTNEVDDFADNNNTAGLLSDGTVINGSIEQSGDADRFLVAPVSQDTTVRVTVETPTPLTDGLLGVIDGPFEGLFGIGRGAPGPDFIEFQVLTDPPLDAQTYVTLVGVPPLTTDYTLSLEVL